VKLFLNFKTVFGGNHFFDRTAGQKSTTPPPLGLHKITFISTIEILFHSIYMHGASGAHVDCKIGNNSSKLKCQLS
jgi:hypothetical protein